MQTPTKEERKAWSVNPVTKFVLQEFKSQMNQTQEDILSLTSSGEDLTRDFYAMKNALLTIENIVEVMSHLDEVDFK
jgi:hypothetical protein